MRLPPDTYVCVAARYGSSRLPGKALIPFGDGNTILSFLISRLSWLCDPNQIIICTTDNSDDDPIIAVAESMNVRSYRGSKLDVMGRFLAATRNIPECTNIVRVTGDNPFTDPEMLVMMSSQHTKHRYDYTYTSQIPRGTRSEIINRDYLQYLHSSICDPNLTEYMTYFLKQDIGQAINLFVDDKQPHYDCHNLTIDTQQDLEAARLLLSHLTSPVTSSSAAIVDTISRCGLQRQTSTEPDHEILNQCTIPHGCRYLSSFKKK